MKENPRYNVLTFRAGDTEIEEIMQGAGGRKTLSEFLLEAALEKARNENAAAYRGRVRALMQGRD